MSKWTELDPNLPRTYVTSMEINYCQRKLYVGTYGRGVWMYDLSSGTPSLSSLQISSNVTWSNLTLDIGCNIDVLAGTTLNISGSTINMAKGTKITVEKGALLYINSSSKIFNSCGEYWQGIEVIGDPAQNQVILANLPGQITPSSLQGICHIESSTIQNMKQGIYLGNFSGSYGGSQIYANNATFLNNRYSIQTATYSNPSGLIGAGYTQCAVNNCTFSLTSIDTFSEHIYLYQTKGFQIRGCTFNGQTSLPLAQRGSGVVGVFSIAEIIPSVVGTPQTNRFNNFYYGILFFNVGTIGDNNHCLKVSDCAFTGNQYGVYLAGVSYARIMSDTFNVPALYNLQYSCTPPCLPPHVGVPSYAIYSSGCNSYKIQDNVISSASTCYTTNHGIISFCSGPTYGIVANNGSGENERIRRNKITGSYYALLALGRNSDQGQTNSGTGLLWQCNDLYSSQQYDIWVAENIANGVTDSGSMQIYQGAVSGINCVDPYSANRFNSSSPPSYNLIRNQKTYSFVYSYLSNGGGDIYQPASIGTTYPITTKTCNTNQAYSVACPDSISTLDYTPANTMIVHQNVAQLSSKLLSDQIWYSKSLANVDQKEFIDLLDSLTAEPFISSELIRQVILNQYAPFASKQLKALLLRHAGANDSIGYYLSKTLVPIFTKGEIADLKQVDDRLSSEGIVQAQTATYVSQFEDMIRAEIDYRVANGDIQNALRILNENLSPNLLPLYADLCIQYNHEAEAQTAIQKLSAFPSTHQNYHLSEILPIILELNKAKDKHKAIEQYKTKLYEVYSFGDVASFKASSLLMAYADTFIQPYLPIDTARKQENVNAYNYWGNVLLIDKSYLQVYPTPASDEVSISGLITDGKQLVMEITDAKGSLIFKGEYKGNELKTGIDTKSWTIGAYFVRLSSDEGSSKSAKIIVNH